MSQSDPPITAAPPTSANPGRPIGMGRVLPGVRQRGEVREPHVVEFRDVTKTYHPGGSNEFTAIRNVRFVVEDLVGKGEFICILVPAAAARARSCA